MNVYRSSLVPAINTSGILRHRHRRLSCRPPLGATMTHGAFLNPATARYPAVVLGAEAAACSASRASRNPIQVWLGGDWFTVVGILKPSSSSPRWTAMALIGFPIAEQYFAL